MADGGTRISVCSVYCVIDISKLLSTCFGRQYGIFFFRWMSMLSTPCECIIRNRFCFMGNKTNHDIIYQARFIASFNLLRSSNTFFGPGLLFCTQPITHRFDKSSRCSYNGEPVLFRGRPSIKQTYTRET